MIIMLEMKTDGGRINSWIQNIAMDLLPMSKKEIHIFHFKKSDLKVEVLKQKIIFLIIHFLSEDYRKIIENNYNS
jgi:hypothetical protein